MQSEHSRLFGFGGIAAILVVTVVVAVAVASIRGTAAWMFWLLVAGQITALLCLAQTWRDARRKRHDSKPAPSSPRAGAARRQRLVTQLRDVRDAVDSLPDAVVLLDKGGRVSWFNTAATFLLGVQQGDVGHPLAERLGDSELGGWLRADLRESAGDMPAPADPSLRLGTTLMPFGSTQQALLARDISTLNRLEQVRRDFVANVSHELRTPLTVIHGYLELLDPSEVPELAPVLGEMRLQSHRMAQIVEDLLTLSRMETRETLPDETVDVASLLETLRREATALSQGRHTITAQVESQTRLRGSIKDLHSAFSNLVSNAVRYTPSGGRIVIGWRQTDVGDGAFSVCDSGLGISSEHLSRLTERFYRVSSSRSRESGGTGLGLSIVKHVLGLHDGRLLIESEPGRGSTFSCVFDATRVLPPAHGDPDWDDAPAA